VAVGYAQQVVAGERQVGMGWRGGGFITTVYPVGGDLLVVAQFAILLVVWFVLDRFDDDDDD
jgi:hypothetical protein